MNRTFCPRSFQVTMAQSPALTDSDRPYVGPAAGRRILGLRLRDAFLIGAVISVVCLASLPRLADFVRTTNERDAQTALALLGPECASVQAAQTTDPTDLSTWSRRLRHRLGDARPLESGAALLYHGYLFAMHPSESGHDWLVAWPRRAPRTGRAVYAWCPADGLLIADAPTAEAWHSADGAPGDLQRSGWSTQAVREVLE